MAGDIIAPGLNSLFSDRSPGTGSELQYRERK